MKTTWYNTFICLDIALWQTCRTAPPRCRASKTKTRKLENKWIGDDTKSAARQSLIYIINQKINKMWRKTTFNMVDGILAMWHDHDIDFARWLHPAMWHVALESWQWIHQVAAPCNVNSPKRLQYRNSTSGFDFDHITTVDMSFCTSLLNFIQIGPLSAEKKWRHVNFQDGGSQPSWILGIQ